MTQQKTKVLARRKIAECSAVDRGAGEGCVVKLIKRDAPPTAFATREAALQAAADAEMAKMAKMAKAAPAQPGSEYEAYRKRLFEVRPTAVGEATLTPVSLPTRS